MNTQMNRRTVGLQIALLLIAGCTSTHVSEEDIAKQNQEVITRFSQNEKTIATLNNLIQLDINAYHTYTQATQALKTSEHIPTLKDIQDEHAQHIQVLSRIVLAMGGIPPVFLLDSNSYRIPGHPSVKTKGSFYQAIEAQEALGVMYNYDALRADLPSNIKRIIEKHLETERIHLACIRMMKK